MHSHNFIAMSHDIVQVHLLDWADIKKYDIEGIVAISA